MAEHPSLKLSPDKRALLFQVSSGEFAANGFKQASLNRIISEVGMSKSSFYHYFKNKSDLFQQVLQQAAEPVLVLHRDFDFDALTAENLWPTIMQRAGELSQLVNNAPGLIDAGRMFYRCMEDPEDRAITEEFVGGFTNWLAKLIARGQQLGVFRDDLPESLLVNIVLSIGLAMDRWMLANWEAHSEAERMAISMKGFDIFVRLLEPQGNGGTETKK